jgi:hypothetical protein
MQRVIGRSPAQDVFISDTVFALDLPSALNTTPTAPEKKVTD